MAGTSDVPNVGAINRSIEELKNGVGLDMTESRDKGRTLKYGKLKDQGALPQHITNLIVNEPKRQPRAAGLGPWPSAACSSGMQIADGTISLSMGDGLFQESQEVYSQTYAKKKEKSLPNIGSLLC